MIPDARSEERKLSGTALVAITSADAAKSVIETTSPANIVRVATNPIT